jgi:hypothetical protein
MRIKLSLLTALIALTVWANQLPIGKWRTHLAYNSVRKIAVADDRVYAISDGALFSVGKWDDAVDTYSKITGLNDNNIVNIGYAAARKTLLIAYANANIDLSVDGTLINIPDIYQKNMTSDKTINDILFLNQYAYLSCEFGIVKLDLNRREVSDTYIIGQNASTVAVKTLCILDDSFYATTSTTIYQAALSGANLVNYANWHAVSNIPTGTANLRAVAYNGMLYLLKEDGSVHRLQSGVWQQNIYQNITDIQVSNGYLLLSSPTRITWLADDGTSGFVPLQSPGMASFDPDKRLIWAAADDLGIAQCTTDGNAVNFFKPNGPAVNMAWRMRHANGKIIVVPGGRWASEYLRPGYVMMFENGEWTNITPAVIEAKTKTDPAISCLDLVDVAIDPSDNTHFYVASYGLGIYEFRDNAIYALYNADNSGVETIYPNKTPATTFPYYRYHRTDGFAYDSAKRLWFVNRGASGVVKYLEPDPDGNGPLISPVKSMPYAEIKNYSTVSDILILSQNENIKLVIVPRRVNDNTTGIFAFDDRGTLDNMNDDRFLLREYFIDQDEKKVETRNFRCAVQDDDGTVWVGHTSGVFLLSNPENFFDADYRCSRIKLAKNDGTQLADLLLDNIQINAISIDGANRKWIATETSGVFLISPDGQETIFHFTSENSPLLSNQVSSIVINNTGEVFFGTGNGIISYQSDAIPGGEVFNNVHAFPNPVRENYHGVITITGLVANTLVKITDINGNLVYETMSNGGVATWDGTRRGGERVSTGIYLALCVSKDGKQHAITKILFIN